LIINIPTYRSDLKMPADIAEEIARIYGYNNIPITPVYGPIIPPKPNLSLNLRRKTKRFLKSIGFTEILSQPFLGKEALKLFKLNPEKHLKLVNPLTVDQEYLRRSLVPSLLPIAKKNLRFFDHLKLFEIDRIFIPQGKKQPKEIINLTAIVIGKNSYLHLKGMVEALMNFLGINPQFKPLLKDSSLWETDQSAELIIKEKESLGKIGKIKKTILTRFNISNDINALEINFSKIAKIADLTKIY
ncbi:unnamed protein product, partial [marine sediment metagenome]